MMARWDSHSIQIAFIIIYVLKVLVYHQVYIYHIISELPARKPFLTLYPTFYWAKYITIYYKRKITPETLIYSSSLSVKFLKGDIS